MAIVFKNTQSNFPVNEEELQARLDKIEKLINSKVARVNIKFVEAAFNLIADCNLISEDNINFLIAPKACQNFHNQFKFLRNPSEAVLRPTNYDYDVLGKDGYSRFYNGTKMRVELDGKRYLISNDWYADHSVCPNKRQFFNWIKYKATAACQKHWAEESESFWKELLAIGHEASIGCQKHWAEENESFPIQPSEVSNTEDTLKSLIKKIETLEKKIDNLTVRVSELKSIIK